MIRADKTKTTLDLIDRLEGLRKVIRTAELAHYSTEGDSDVDAVGWTFYICGREAEDIQKRLQEFADRDPRP